MLKIRPFSGYAFPSKLAREKPKPLIRVSSAHNPGLHQKDFE